MQLLPIDIDDSLNGGYANDPECLDILKIYADFYKKVGYHKPWIGYFFSQDGKKITGCGGYKGKPQEGIIEIAYGTFKRFEGQGIGTEICRQLVLLALRTDKTLRITARTLPEKNASTNILKKNGFICLGIVCDPEDGDVWEWEFKK